MPTNGELTIICSGAILLTLTACQRPGRMAILPSIVAAAPAEDITAALPVIRDAKFNLADHCSVVRISQ